MLYLSMLLPLGIYYTSFVFFSSSAFSFSNNKWRNCWLKIKEATCNLSTLALFIPLILLTRIHISSIYNILN